MENNMLDSVGKIAVGDRVVLKDRSFTGEAAEITATVLEIREILGKETYVVETAKGGRKVIGGSQIVRVSEE